METKSREEAYQKIAVKMTAACAVAITYLEAMLEDGEAPMLKLHLLITTLKASAGFATEAGMEVDAEFPDLVMTNGRNLINIMQRFANPQEEV